MSQHLKHTKKETQLFKAKKITHQLVQLTGKTSINNPSEIQNKLKAWKCLFSKDLPPEPSWENEAEVSQWHEIVKKWDKSYKKMLQLQTRQEQAKSITEAIVTRENNFVSNKGNMIKSILD